MEPSRLMQKTNRLRVLNHIRRNPGCSRPVIARDTGLSLSSLTNITNYLLEAGLVEECGMEQASRVGRKSTLLQINAGRYHLICVFIRAESVSLYATDLLGAPLCVRSEDIAGCDANEALHRMVSALRQLIIEEHLTPLAIGVAVSGLVLEHTSFVMSSELEWRNVNLKDKLSMCLGRPVFVANNSQLRAAWYYHRYCSPEDNLVFLDLAGGIGAVQFAAGGLCRSTLGEIGHTTVKADGDPCFCGNRGCLEAMCSTKRLMAIYEKAAGSPPGSVWEVERAAARKDPAGLTAVTECGTYLGLGMANLVNLLNPTVLAVNTGGFSHSPGVLQAAEAELRRRAFPDLTRDLQVRQVTLEEHTMVSGMAQLLWDRVFDLSFEGNIVE